MTNFDRATTTHGLQLRSLLKSGGELELSLASVEIPQPEANEVIVRVEAAPVNPSDLALLFGPADLGTLEESGSTDRPGLTVTVPEKFMNALAARIGQSMPVGNEGAGVVVDAGSDPKAQALLGKNVAFASGATYAQYVRVVAHQCLRLPDGVAPKNGASAFVNPLTALGMTETMRAEGHTALVHTAAASSLGQMLVRLCNQDGIPLVNVVRKDEQVALLREVGAKHVCNSSSPTFVDDLTDALAETGATIAFDAIGGGKLAGQILGAMERAINRKATNYSRYGSSTHKQVYIYGALDTGPTELARTFGFAWGLGGWLLTPFLVKLGAGADELRARVGAELMTTFATSYAKELSLAEMLSPKEVSDYARKTTGGKVLVLPNR